MNQLISLFLSTFNNLAPSVPYLQPKKSTTSCSAFKGVLLYFRWISHFIFYRENLPTRNFIKPPSMDSQTTRGMYTISACSNKTTNQKTRGDRNIGKTSLDKQGRWQPTGSRCCTAPPHSGPSCYNDPRRNLYLQITWCCCSNSKERFCLLP